MGLYVCGPTVYDHIHLGNARCMTVFDALYRLLCHLFPQVIYVRNITDVDDKINAAAALQSISLEAFTQQTTQWFLEDAKDLGLLSPTHEPRATHFIAEIVALIQELLIQGFAYVHDGHVLFSVRSWPGYGGLSRMSLHKMKVGARVEVAPYKEDPLDFVLWKPSLPNEIGWPSPWGWGRPGWHSECTVMSQQYLGPLFDIHGGGQDLLFPHHENERAQTCCLSAESDCAQYWMHTEMLLVDGKKMSKSLGNFFTLRQALEKHPGDYDYHTLPSPTYAHIPPQSSAQTKVYRGEVLRWALLSSHYRKALHWDTMRFQQAIGCIDNIYHALQYVREFGTQVESEEGEVDEIFLQALCDDLNTPMALQRLSAMGKMILRDPTQQKLVSSLLASGHVLGLLQYRVEDGARKIMKKVPMEVAEIEIRIAQRDKARKDGDYKRADRIRDCLWSCGILLEDHPSGTLWRKR